MVNELEIQRGIIVYLKSRNIPFTVSNVSSTRHRGKGQRITRGWPDITAVMPPLGRALLIEVKAKRGVVSEEQAALHEVLRQAGALVVVARSVSEVSDALWREEGRRRVLPDRGGIPVDTRT